MYNREQFRKRAEKWLDEIGQAKGIQLPKPFWEFMARWPEIKGMTRPLDVIEVLSSGESTGGNLKEAATILFWYAYYYGDADSERSRCSEFIECKEFTECKDKNNNALLRYYLNEINTCTDIISFRDNFVLDSIRIPHGPHKLAIQSYVTMMAGAAKVFLLLEKSTRFDADLKQLLKNIYELVKSGDVVELDDFAKGSFKYNGYTIEDDISGFSACIAAGIICNSYAHLMNKDKDFLAAFLANCRAVSYLEKAAACLGEYIDVFDLPCCQHGFDCAEIQRTVDMWEQIKRHDYQTANWNETEEALRQLDDITWEMCEGTELIGYDGKSYPLETYFECQYEVCRSRKTWEPTSSKLTNIVIEPDQPYSNVTKFRRILRDSEDFIWWADPHFNARGLEELPVDDFQTVREIRILSGPANVNKRGKKDFERFKKELMQKSVTVEWRILERFGHDRFVISKNFCYNVPPINTLLRGNYSEINQTPNCPPFERWWQKAKPIEDWSC